MKRLMQALMDKAKTMMDSKSDFSDVISYLQLANQIHPAAGPTPLLRFYLFSFGKEATLRRLAQPQLVWVAKEFAKIHMACGLRKDLDQVQTTAIRKQVIQWSWLLLEVCNTRIWWSHLTCSCRSYTRNILSWEGRISAPY